MSPILWRRRRLGGGILTAVAAFAMGLAMSGCRGESVDQYLSAGDAAMRAAKPSEAERNYREAVKLAPDEVRTHFALGNFYVVEHKSSPAQVEFMKALELEPKNAQAHVALGNLYADQAQYGFAEEQYRAAAVLDPARPDYRLNLGAALVKQGKLADAESEIRTAIGLDPRNAPAHLALANLLALQPNRRTEAEAEYQQARALDPKLARPAPAMPAPAAPAAEASAPATAATAKVKPLNQLFLLTHGSPLYASPDAGSRVVGHVAAKKYVHVVGIAGKWLQVRLRNGTVGFVPASAAE